MRILQHRRLYPALAALIAVLLATAVGLVSAGSAAAFTATAHGAPARPAAPASPDPSLTAHALTASTVAPASAEPLKGFAEYYFPGSDENANVYPHSIQWSYFGLSEVMTDPTNCASYDWSVVDNALKEIASYGNQAAIRFYIEYPGGTGTHPGNAIPHCFDGHVAYRNNTYWGTVSPDYDSPYLLNALDGFIAAFAARYDGDPRIGFIQAGLVGLWGEWHTWPFDGIAADGGYPNFMPTNADAARIIDDYADDFHRTKVEVRYPTSAGGAANNLDIGYHDDSFCYKEGSPLAGVTLPQSLGGANYAQLQLDLDMGTENKWTTDSMGGEVRPEIQSSAFSYWPGGSGQVDDMQACIELEHTTWKLDQSSTSYSPTDPNVAAAVSEMGYNLTANNAYFTSTASGSAEVGVQISNTGVAPFYYPWTVTLGLEDSTGHVVKTWNTPWDLRTVMPLKIRAYPDWNAGSDPTYLNYGYPQYFQTDVDLSGVSAGSYQWVMSVDNPLSSVSTNAKPLLFSNTTQNANGWLGLGSVTVGAASAGTAPAAPTALAATRTASTISLNWTAPSGSVAGYEVFRDGTLIATTDTAKYTDPSLPTSSSHSYTVEAFDAAGDLSAASAPLTATTGSGTDTTAPNAPTGLAATATSGDSVNLSWTAPGDDTGVASFQIFRNGTKIGSSTLTNYTDLELTPGTAYSYTVKAVDAAGNVSAASSAAAATTGASTGDTTAPSTPTGLTTPTQTGTALDLSWTASTDAGGVVGYQVLRNGVVVGTTSASTIGTTNVPTPTLFTDTGLTPSTSYTYTVKAFDAAGNVSAASAPISASTTALSTSSGGGGGGSDTTPPSVPSGLSSPSQTSSSVNLSWSASSDNVGVTGYDVYRNGTKIGNTTSTTFSDTGLNPSTSYTYTVDAYDAAGNVSAQSSSLTVATASACNGDCTPPSAPSGLLASAETGSSTTFTWTASTDNTSVAGYDVYRNGTKVGTSTATSYTDSGLSPSTSYTYTVDAVDPSGNVSDRSGSLTVSTTASGTSGYEAESRSATLAGGAKVQDCSACSGGETVGYIGDGGTLTVPGITAATAGTYPLTIYYVDGDAGRTGVLSVNGTDITVSFHGTNDNNWNAVQSVTTNVTLKAGSSNTVEISNASGWAPDIDQITLGAGSGTGDTTAPSVPSGLSSPSQTSSSVSLSWSASTDNVGVAGYDVYRNGTKVGMSATPSYTDSGLTASTSYSYTVDAFDAAGNVSAKSSALSVSTLSGSGSAAVYEADASVNTLTGGAVVTSCSVCLDGNKVGYVGDGATLAFNDVSAASAGSKTLTIYYIDGDAGRTGVVTVDGVSTSVSFHGTNDGNWNLVQSLTVTVTLNAGSSNTIEISNPSGWAADIDHITV